MKTKLLYLFSVLLCIVVASCSSEEFLEEQTKNPTGQVSSNYVSLEEALKNVTPFRAESRAVEEEVLSVSTFFPCTGTRSSDEVVGFYLVNFGNEEGFAILSNDRRLNSVYAYSESGSISLNDTLENKGLSHYVNVILAEEVADVGNGDSTSDYVIPNPPGIGFTDKIIYKMPPMLTKQVRGWHQEAPFNNACTLAQGYTVVTGCASVAVAQYLSVFEFPSTISTPNLSQQQTALNWSLIKSADETSSYTGKVAVLMYALGQPQYLNISYSPTFSGASMDIVIPTMRKLGYKNGEMAAFSASKVKSRLIENSEPSMVIGGGGYDMHIYIIDAYLTRKQGDPTGASDRLTDYLHCVWGWKNRKNNGWYYYSSSNKRFETGTVYTEDDETSTESVPDYQPLYMINGFTR